MSRILDVPQSGKRGTVVSVKTRYGQIQRQYVQPRDPKTPAQMTIRSNLARVFARWRALTDEQRSAWTVRGGDVETRRRLRRKTFLTGCQFSKRFAPENIRTAPPCVAGLTWQST